MLTLCILVGAAAAWLCLLFAAFKVAMHFEPPRKATPLYPRPTNPTTYSAVKEAEMIINVYQNMLLRVEGDKDV